MWTSKVVSFREKVNKMTTHYIYKCTLALFLSSEKSKYILANTRDTSQTTHINHAIFSSVDSQKQRILFYQIGLK